jgi:hypothetical protein
MAGERERERERANLGSSSKWDIPPGSGGCPLPGFSGNGLNGWKWRKADTAESAAKELWASHR